MDIQQEPGKPFFGVKIERETFHFVDYKEKPYEHDSAIKTLRTIEEIVRAHLSYADETTDRLKLEGKKPLEILGAKSREIYAKYKAKESTWTWFVALFKEIVLREPRIDTILGNIEKSIKSDLELERAKELGFEGEDPSEAATYLQNLFTAVRHYAREGIIKPEYLVGKNLDADDVMTNLDPDATLKKMKSDLTKEDTFTILAHHHSYSRIIAEIFHKNWGLKGDNTSKGGEKALSYAATYGNEKIIPFLLEQGVFVNANGGEALHLAVRAGNLEAVKILYESGANLDARREGSLTAFMEACLNGHKEIAEFLFTKGADPSILAEDGSSALDLVYDRYTPGKTLAKTVDELVDFLKEKGVTSTRLNRAKKLGFEGDDVRAAGEYLKKIFALVGDYATRGIIDEKYLVRIDGSLDADKTLKEMEASLTKKDACKILAHYEGTELNPKVSSEFRKIFNENLILQQGDEAVGEEGRKALLLAVRLGDVGIVKFLLNYDIDSVAKAEALHQAIEGNREEIVTTLLQDGNVNVNEKVGGMTPFMTACVLGHLELATFLLEQGADRHAVNSGGKNALDLMGRVYPDNKKAVLSFLQGKGLLTSKERSTSK